MLVLAVVQLSTIIGCVVPSSSKLPQVGEVSLVGPIGVFHCLCSLFFLREEGEEEPLNHPNGVLHLNTWSNAHPLLKSSLGVIGRGRVHRLRSLEGVKSQFYRRLK